jgi:lysine decarboxylase
MVLRGEELLDGALQLAAEVRAAIEKVPGLHVLGHDDLVRTGLAVDFDPLPTVIDATGLGTGYRAADWLRHERHVDMHLADHRRISAQLTHADSTATAGRLLDALRESPSRPTSWPTECPTSSYRPARRCGWNRLSGPVTRTGPAEPVPIERP